VTDGTQKGDRLLWIQGPRLVIALFAFVLTGGTAGYVLIEGWGGWDAFYMTVITITTVGFGEVHPLSHGGQVFTAGLVVVGVGATLYAFSLLAASVFEGGLRRRLAARRLMRMIDELRDHFILCGSGRIGSMIAEEFRRQHIRFIVIDRDPDRVRAILERGDLVVEADASREEVLKRVGIDRARGLIAAVGTDAENVYTVLTARVLRPDLFIIGRADSEDARRKLLRAGANRVVSPYQIGALQLAQTALRPAVVDFVELATRSENLELAMEQVRIGEGSSLANRSIVEASLRQRFGVIVVGIQRSEGRMEFNPAPEAVMHAGDQLVVLGRPEQFKDLESAALEG
jgi:voltage-gated potassium channel